MLLYFDGERLCEASIGGKPQVTLSRSLRAAASSLRAHINFEQYQETVTNYRVAAMTKGRPERCAPAYGPSSSSGGGRRRSPGPSPEA